MATSLIHYRDKGDDICPVHTGQFVQFVCRDCPGTLVCKTCVVSNHSGHKCIAISEIIVEKKRNIISFINQANTRYAPKILTEIEKTGFTLQQMKEGYLTEIQKVKTYGETLKEEVDLSTNKKVSILEDLLQNIEELLHSHTTMLNTLLQDLKREIEECEEIMKSEDEEVLLFDTEPFAADFPEVEIQSMPFLTSAVFVPLKQPKQLIENAFGEIETQSSFGDSLNKYSPLVCSEMTDDHLSIQGQHATEALKALNMQLDNKKVEAFLDKPITLYRNNISGGVKVNCLCPTPNNTAWLLSTDNKLRLFDHTGTKQRKLKLDKKCVLKICSHPITGHLYCCYTGEHCIRRVDIETGETSVVFGIENVPCSMACTADNFMVVGVAGYIKKFTFQGDVICDYESGDHVGLSVCSITGNVAVIRAYKGVTLLDSKLLKLRQINNCCALTATFTKQYLFIGDCDRDMIHVVDGATGQHVHDLHILKMKEIRAMATQQNDVIWLLCKNPDKMMCVKVWK